MIAKYEVDSASPPAINASSLPQASSSDLVLVPGTLQEYEQTWHLNSNEWKGPLELSQYIEREHFLLKQDLTNKGQATSWILTSTKLSPTDAGARPIVASCETLLKSAYVARNGKISNVRVHGIGSVYTRPEHRGRGYAARMMTELAKKLDNWQQKDGESGSFSVLYSDIGQNFYSRFGWSAFSSTHINLEPLSNEEYNDLKAHHPTVEDLGGDDLDAIPATAYLEERLKALSLRNLDVPCVAIRPDMQHFRWHHAREELQSQMLSIPFPYIKGAVHKETGIALIWSRVFAFDEQEWSLHILHVVIPPEHQRKQGPEAQRALAALFLRAQHEAYVWRMVAGVEVWDPSKFVIAAAQSLRAEEQGKVQVITRDKEHICSLKWIGALPGDDPSGKVIWAHCEKYAWC